MSEHKQSALEWFFVARKSHEQLQAELSASQAREAELREKLEATKRIAEVAYRKMGEAEGKVKNWGLLVSAISSELADCIKRAQAAEARIAAADKQKPIGVMDAETGKASKSHRDLADQERIVKVIPLYTSAPIPPDYAKQIAELQRELESAHAELANILNMIRSPEAMPPSSAPLTITERAVANLLYTHKLLSAPKPSTESGASPETNIDKAQRHA